MKRIIFMFSMLFPNVKTGKAVFNYIIDEE